MKATMTSTSTLVDVEVPGVHGARTTALARVWEGVTEAGVRFTAYISLVQVHKDHDGTEFNRDLRENSPKPSRDTLRAIDMRHF